MPICVCVCDFVTGLSRRQCFYPLGSVCVCVDVCLAIFFLLSAASMSTGACHFALDVNCCLVLH